MEVHDAALLGIIQGLTEFLPVSSSGHLVLFQKLLGLTEPEIYFDIAVHVGTLVAICVFFSKDLKGIVTAIFSTSTWTAGRNRSGKSLAEKPEMRLLLLILVGTVPTALLGLLLRPVAPKIFSSVQLVGIMLFVTGVLIWLTGRVKKGERDAGRITVRDALHIGVMQGIAIIPGISRSGTTIAVGLFRGLERETAARYSFLLSIPAIVGAMVWEVGQTPASYAPPVQVVAVGTLTAAVVGYAALTILIYLVKKGELHYFAPYCWLLGLVAIVSSL